MFELVKVTIQLPILFSILEMSIQFSHQLDKFCNNPSDILWCSILNILLIYKGRHSCPVWFLCQLSYDKQLQSKSIDIRCNFSTVPPSTRCLELWQYFLSDIVWLKLFEIDIHFWLAVSFSFLYTQLLEWLIYSTVLYCIYNSYWFQIQP